MKSLIRRLFLILVATTGLIWLFAVAWIYIGAKREVESVLDTRLQEAARMVSSLVSSSTLASRELHSSYLSEIPSYERQLSCQIWSLDGRLVARSSGAPDSKSGDIRAGFSERLIDGETWRVYTIEDVAKGVRVQVGDRLGLREHLVAELIEGLLAPTLLIIPLLGFLIWASLDRGLKPLQAIVLELSQRSADDMSPMETGRVPTEIHPVIASLNALFAKVQAARRHEREFIAFAAHELRTPLAGLRTQAQISIAATERPVRESALRQILVAVDRSTRLVRQLLALAKLDSAREKVQLAEVNLGEVLQAVIEELPASDQNAGVTIDPELHRATLVANREWLHLAMRNLHENAVHHMPRHGLIRWSMATTSESVTISIEDEGPGIPTEEIPLVTSRFFRGRHKSALGSGLGLSIVEVALRANDAELHLSNRTDRSGLRADMVWRFRRDPSQARLKSERPLVATDQVWQQPLRAV
jgi:two-component system sensor histidine kinase QseC